MDIPTAREWLRKWSFGAFLIMKIKNHSQEEQKNWLNIINQMKNDMDTKRFERGISPIPVNDYD